MEEQKKQKKQQRSEEEEDAAAAIMSLHSTPKLNRLLRLALQSGGPKSRATLEKVEASARAQNEALAAELQSYYNPPTPPPQESLTSFSSRAKNADEFEIPRMEEEEKNLEISSSSSSQSFCAKKQLNSKERRPPVIIDTDVAVQYEKLLAFDPLNKAHPEVSSFSSQTPPNLETPLIQAKPFSSAAGLSTSEKSSFPSSSASAVVAAAAAAHHHPPPDTIIRSTSSSSSGSSSGSGSASVAVQQSPLEMTTRHSNSHSQSFGNTHHHHHPQSSSSSSSPPPPPPPPPLSSSISNNNNCSSSSSSATRRSLQQLCQFKYMGVGVEALHLNKRAIDSLLQCRQTFSLCYSVPVQAIIIQPLPSSSSAAAAAAAQSSTSSFKDANHYTTTTTTTAAAAAAHSGMSSSLRRPNSSRVRSTSRSISPPPLRIKTSGRSGGASLRSGGARSSKGLKDDVEEMFKKAANSLTPAVLNRVSEDVVTASCRNVENNQLEFNHRSFHQIKICLNTLNLMVNTPLRFALCADVNLTDKSSKAKDKCLGTNNPKGRGRILRKEKRDGDKNERSFSGRIWKHVLPPGLEIVAIGEARWQKPIFAERNCCQIAVDMKEVTSSPRVVDDPKAAVSIGPAVLGKLFVCLILSTDFLFKWPQQHGNEEAISLQFPNLDDTLDEGRSNFDYSAALPFLPPSPHPTPGHLDVTQLSPSITTSASPQPITIHAPTSSFVHHHPPSSSSTTRGPSIRKIVSIHLAVCVGKMWNLRPHQYFPTRMLYCSCKLAASQETQSSTIMAVKRGFDSADLEGNFMFLALSKDPLWQIQDEEVVRGPSLSQVTVEVWEKSQESPLEEDECLGIITLPIPTTANLSALREQENYYVAMDEPKPIKEFTSSQIVATCQAALIAGPLQQLSGLYSDPRFPGLAPSPSLVSATYVPSSQTFYSDREQREILDGGGREEKNSSSSSSSHPKVFVQPPPPSYDIGKEILDVSVVDLSPPLPCITSLSSKERSVGAPLPHVPIQKEDHKRANSFLAFAHRFVLLKNIRGTDLFPISSSTDEDGRPKSAVKTTTKRELKNCLTKKGLSKREATALAEAICYKTLHPNSSDTSSLPDEAPLPLTLPLNVTSATRSSTPHLPSQTAESIKSIQRVDEEEVISLPVELVRSYIDSLHSAASRIITRLVLEGENGAASLAQNLGAGRGAQMNRAAFRTSLRQLGLMADSDLFDAVCELLDENHSDTIDLSLFGCLLTRQAVQQEEDDIRGRDMQEDIYNVLWERRVTPEVLEDKLTQYKKQDGSGTITSLSFAHALKRLVGNNRLVDEQLRFLGRHLAVTEAENRTGKVPRHSVLAAGVEVLSISIFVEVYRGFCSNKRIQESLNKSILSLGVSSPVTMQFPDVKKRRPLLPPQNSDQSFPTLKSGRNEEMCKREGSLDDLSVSMLEESNFSKLPTKTDVGRSRNSADSKGHLNLLRYKMDHAEKSLRYDEDYSEEKERMKEVSSELTTVRLPAFALFWRKLPAMPAARHVISRLYNLLQSGGISAAQASKCFVECDDKTEDDENAKNVISENKKPSSVAVHVWSRLGIAASLKPSQLAFDWLIQFAVDSTSDLKKYNNIHSPSFVTNTKTKGTSKNGFGKAKLLQQVFESWLELDELFFNPLTAELQELFGAGSQVSSGAVCHLFERLTSVGLEELVEGKGVTAVNPSTDDWWKELSGYWRIAISPFDLKLAATGLALTSDSSPRDGTSQISTAEVASKFRAWQSNSHIKNNSFPMPHSLTPVDNKTAASASTTSLVFGGLIGKDDYEILLQCALALPDYAVFSLLTVTSSSVATRGKQLKDNTAYGPRRLRWATVARFFEGCMGIGSTEFEKLCCYLDIKITAAIFYPQFRRLMTHLKQRDELQIYSNTTQSRLKQDFLLWSTMCLMPGDPFSDALKSKGLEPSDAVDAESLPQVFAKLQLPHANARAAYMFWRCGSYITGRSECTYQCFAEWLIAAHECSDAVIEIAFAQLFHLHHFVKMKDLFKSRLPQICGSDVGESISVKDFGCLLHEVGMDWFSSSISKAEFLQAADQKGRNVLHLPWLERRYELYLLKQAALFTEIVHRIRAAGLSFEEFISDKLEKGETATDVRLSADPKEIPRLVFVEQLQRLLLRSSCCCREDLHDFFDTLDWQQKGVVDSCSLLAVLEHWQLYEERQVPDEVDWLSENNEPPEDEAWKRSSLAFSHLVDSISLLRASILQHHWTLADVLRKLGCETCWDKTSIASFSLYRTEFVDSQFIRWVEGLSENGAADLFDSLIEDQLASDKKEDDMSSARGSGSVLLRLSIENNLLQVLKDHPQFWRRLGDRILRVVFIESIWRGKDIILIVREAAENLWPHDASCFVSRWAVIELLRQTVGTKLLSPMDWECLMDRYANKTGDQKIVFTKVLTDFQREHQKYRNVLLSILRNVDPEKYAAVTKKYDKEKNGTIAFGDLQLILAEYEVELSVDELLYLLRNDKVGSTDPHGLPPFNESLFDPSLGKVFYERLANYFTTAVPCDFWWGSQPSHNEVKGGETNQKDDDSILITTRSILLGKVCAEENEDSADSLLTSLFFKVYEGMLKNQLSVRQAFEALDISGRGVLTGEALRWAAQHFLDINDPTSIPKNFRLSRSGFQRNLLFHLDKLQEASEEIFANQNEISVKEFKAFFIQRPVEEDDKIKQAKASEATEDRFFNPLPVECWLKLMDVGRPYSKFIVTPTLVEACINQHYLQNPALASVPTAPRQRPAAPPTLQSLRRKVREHSSMKLIAKLQHAARDWALRWGPPGKSHRAVMQWLPKRYAEPLLSRIFSSSECEFLLTEANRIAQMFLRTLEVAVTGHLKIPNNSVNLGTAGSGELQDSLRVADLACLLDPYDQHEIEVRMTDVRGLPTTDCQWFLRYSFRGADADCETRALRIYAKTDWDRCASAAVDLLAQHAFGTWSEEHLQNLMLPAQDVLKVELWARENPGDAIAVKNHPLATEMKWCGCAILHVMELVNFINTLSPTDKLLGAQTSRVLCFVSPESVECPFLYVKIMYRCRSCVMPSDTSLPSKSAVFSTVYRGASLSRTFNLNFHEAKRPITTPATHPPCGVQSYEASKDGDNERQQFVGPNVVGGASYADHLIVGVDVAGKGTGTPALLSSTKRVEVQLILQDVLISRDILEQLSLGEVLVKENGDYSSTAAPLAMYLELAEFHTSPLDNPAMERTSTKQRILSRSAPRVVDAGIDQQRSRASVSGYKKQKKAILDNAFVTVDFEHYESLKNRSEGLALIVQVRCLLGPPSATEDFLLAEALVSLPSENSDLSSDSEQKGNISLPADTQLCQLFHTSFYFDFVLHTPLKFSSDLSDGARPTLRHFSMASVSKGSVIGRLQIKATVKPYNHAFRAITAPSLSTPLRLSKGVNLPSGLFVCPYALHEIPIDSSTNFKVCGPEVFRDLYGKMFDYFQSAVEELMQSEAAITEVDADCWRTGWMRLGLFIDALVESEMKQELHFLQQFFPGLRTDSPAVLKSAKDCQAALHFRHSPSLCPVIFFYPLLNLLAVRAVALKLHPVVPELAKEVIRAEIARPRSGSVSWTSFQQAVLRSHSPQECALEAVEWMWLHRWRPWQMRCIDSLEVTDYVALLRDIQVFLQLPMLTVLQNQRILNAPIETDESLQTDEPLQVASPVIAEQRNAEEKCTPAFENVVGDDKVLCPTHLKVCIFEGLNFPRIRGVLPNSFVTTAVVVEKSSNPNIISHRESRDFPCNDEWDSSKEGNILNNEQAGSVTIFRHQNPYWNFHHCLRLPSLKCSWSNDGEKPIKQFMGNVSPLYFRDVMIRVSLWHYDISPMDSDLPPSPRSAKPFPWKQSDLPPTGCILFGTVMVPLSPISGGLPNIDGYYHVSPATKLPTRNSTNTETSPVYGQVRVQVLLPTYFPETSRGCVKELKEDFYTKATSSPDVKVAQNATTNCATFAVGNDKKICGINSAEQAFDKTLLLGGVEDGCDTGQRTGKQDDVANVTQNIAKKQPGECKDDFDDVSKYLCNLEQILSSKPDKELTATHHENMAMLEDFNRKMRCSQYKDSNLESEDDSSSLNLDAPLIPPCIPPKDYPRSYSEERQPMSYLGATNEQTSAQSHSAADAPSNASNKSDNSAIKETTHIRDSTAANEHNISKLLHTITGQIRELVNQQQHTADTIVNSLPAPLNSQRSGVLSEAISSLQNSNGNNDKSNFGDPSFNNTTQLIQNIVQSLFQTQDCNALANTTTSADFISYSDAKETLQSHSLVTSYPSARNCMLDTLLTNQQSHSLPHSYSTNTSLQRESSSPAITTSSVYPTMIGVYTADTSSPVCSQQNRNVSETAYCAQEI